jgi:hypothetical protein
MKRGITTVFSTGFSLVFAVAAAQTFPSWKMDSTVDKMSDKKVIWAELPAIRPLDYRWGRFRPSLTVLCFTGSEKTASNDGLALRFVSHVSPTITSFDYEKMTRMTVRFDSANAEPFDFYITDSGDGSFMEPSGGSGTLKVDSTGHRYYDLNFHQTRDDLVRQVIGAHRLLVQYTLITDETVIAEFNFDAQTRSAVERVFRACGQQPPS